MYGERELRPPINLGVQFRWLGFHKTLLYVGCFHATAGNSSRKLSVAVADGVGSYYESLSGLAEKMLQGRNVAVGSVLTVTQERVAQARNFPVSLSNTDINCRHCYLQDVSVLGRRF